jgi:hypothetical protein
MATTGRKPPLGRLKAKAKRGFRGYPLATVALYGPDDKCATKVAVGIIMGEREEPEHLERWFSEEQDIRKDRGVAEQIFDFVRGHGAKTVVMTDRIIGCPHEEEIDYPAGEACPFCPFWANRDRWTGDPMA